MKRFVYVPADLAKNEKSMQLASKISHESRLSVRVGCHGDEIKKTEVGIVSFPEKNFLSCDETVKAGYICALDITNEFVMFNKTTTLTAICPEGFVHSFKPVLSEKHLVKFRFRLFSLGIHNYSVEQDNQTIYFGEIEVV